MGRKKQPDSFWLSYSDLMTSLFFIMLVLFVVSIVVLKSAPNSDTQILALQKENAELKEEIKRLEKELKKAEKEKSDLQKDLGEYKIREDLYKKLWNLDTTFKSLSANSTLQYVEKYKTFIAKDFAGIEIFEPGKAIIKSQYISTVDRVGRDLQKLLADLYETNRETVSYMLIIEGNTANTWDHQFDPDNESAYNLSYQRAMALYKRWHKLGIDLRQYNTEIQICGSGMNGINRDNQNEENNKRFVIQIIPKISRIDTDKDNK